MTTPTDNRLQQGFVLLLLAIASGGFLGMIRNFLIALLLAAIFAGLLYPFYSRLRVWLGGRKAVAALLTIGATMLAIGLPLVSLMGVVISEALHLGEQFGPAIKEAFSQDISEHLPGWLPFLERLEPFRENILNKLATAANSIGNWLLASISTVTQDTFGLLLSMFVLLYAMFFFFTRGTELLQSLAVLLPMSAADREQVLQRGLAVTRASLKGILLVGALQGTLVGLAFWLCGLYGPVFWGAMVFILSAIPGLGAPLIWLPAVAYLFLTGKIGWGIGLAVWGVLVVGLVDNLLRPLIVGRDAKLPDLVILVAILGGIATFGAVGIILGPIIAAVLDTVLNIYRRTFADHLP